MEWTQEKNTYYNFMWAIITKIFINLQTEHTFSILFIHNAKSPFKNNIQNHW